MYYNLFYRYMSYIILEELIQHYNIPNDILLCIYDYSKPNKINIDMYDELMAETTLYNYNCIKREYDKECILYNQKMNDYIFNNNNNYMYMVNPPTFEDKIFSFYGSKNELKIQLKNLLYFKEKNKDKYFSIIHYIQLTNALAYAEDLFDDIEDSEYYNTNIEI